MTNEEKVRETKKLQTAGEALYRALDLMAGNEPKLFDDWRAKNANLWKRICHVVARDYCEANYGDFFDSEFWATGTDEELYDHVNTSYYDFFERLVSYDEMVWEFGFNAEQLTEAFGIKEDFHFHFDGWLEPIYYQQLTWNPVEPGSSLGYWA